MMQINELLDKIWDAFYKEEDELEKKFVGTAESDAWFSTYRHWMQQGFDVAIDVIAKEKERANNFVSLRPIPAVWDGEREGHNKVIICGVNSMTDGLNTTITSKPEKRNSNLIQGIFS